MQAEFWNRRYTQADYAYGKEANDFLKTQRFKQAEKVLCLAEGEGRNAVWIARQGAEVTALDYAEAGLLKAKRLADEKGVQLNTLLADLEQYAFEDAAWDTIVCVFGHFPMSIRRRVMGAVYKALKPGGRLIMEVYSKQQLQYKTGGPVDIDMLYSEAELQEALSEFESLEIVYKERFIQEGAYHSGNSAILQVLAKKEIAL